MPGQRPSHPSGQEMTNTRKKRQQRKKERKRYSCPDHNVPYFWHATEAYWRCPQTGCLNKITPEQIGLEVMAELTSEFPQEIFPNRRVQ